MQIKNEDYNPEIHLKIRCLCVRQPYADLLTQTPWRDENGIWRAEKTIEVRSRKTNFRGDVLICASRQPEIPGHVTGCAVGFVEIYDVKPISAFTEDDWSATCIPEPERQNYKDGFGWLVRNPRRIVEMPVVGKLGFFDIVVPKEDLTEYPRSMAIGNDGWDIIKKKIRNGK